MAENKAYCNRCPLKKGHFWLNYKDPSVFSRSQWPIPRWAFQVYRICFMMYLVAWEVITIIDGVTYMDAYVLIFLTNWAYHALTLYGIVAAMTSVFFHCKAYDDKPAKTSVTYELETEKCGYVNSAFDENQFGAPHRSKVDVNNGVEGFNHSNYEPDSPEGQTNMATSQAADRTSTSQRTNPWYFKISWVLFNINITVSPVVTIIYWGLLHDFSAENGAGTDPIGYGVNLNTHALNSVLIILDLFLTAIPVRIEHFVYGWGFGIAYAIFSVIYWLAGGVNPYTGEPAIYPILDWEEIPGITSACIIGLLVGVVVIQFIAFLLAKFRDYIPTKCCQV